ncbi:hypothetical protein GCK72_014465 [Caenorhabditis remanei]|uniref:Uncharacterized protein n=1 Tax=Caenorhabditis remanei TaxID=31234 RepID=A0A6A5GS43_CAERE|nr:hypothetical protein GCK72_014465 [Caenorhabditis remanei]KAF1758007.1 hypothetical protein GCK72_014465 [Caenorhabditis remanei]
MLLYTAMNSFSALVTIALLISTVSSAGNVCKTGNVLNRPVNDQPVYWPATWRENQSAPALEAEQSCSWIVTVPSGYYAKLIISGKMNDNISHFQTIDSAGNFVQTTHEGEQPYYFPSPKFTLAMSNEKAATFGFKIVWGKYPSGLKYDMGVSRSPVVVNITKDIFAAEYSGTSGISLFAFPANPKNYFSLRSTLVFEGKDFNGRYISNLYSLYQSRKQFLSSGLVYIVNLEASNVLDQLLIQDSAYTNNLQQYSELDCPINSTCSVTINGGDKASALVTVGEKHQVLLDLVMQVSAWVTVYYGSINNFGYYKSYAGESILSNLPMTFDSEVVHYVISHGKASFTFQMNP